MQSFGGKEALSSAMGRAFKGESRVMGIMMLGAFALFLKIILGYAFGTIYGRLGVSISLGSIGGNLFAFIAWGLVPAFALMPIAAMTVRGMLLGEEWPSPGMLYAHFMKPHGTAALRTLLGLTVVCFGPAAVLAMIGALILPSPLLAWGIMLAVGFGLLYRFGPRWLLCIPAAAVEEPLSWAEAGAAFIRVQGEVAGALARLMLMVGGIVVMLGLVRGLGLGFVMFGDIAIMLVLAFAMGILADVLAQAYAAQTLPAGGPEPVSGPRRSTPAEVKRRPITQEVRSKAQRRKTGPPGGFGRSSVVKSRPGPITPPPARSDEGDGGNNGER
ncbi:MAG: hypothetical protein V3R73_00605 [Sphingomonadales bacterium]